MKILISSCLLGENVRYDGKNSLIKDNEEFKNILQNHEIFSFCPEVSSGLQTPREPVEFISLSPLKLADKNNKDMTKDFIQGAKNCLNLCKSNNIKVALMKAKSPSCSNDKIYDGTFSKTIINGAGISAKMLAENGIKVFNENQIDEFINFLQTA